MRTTGFGTSAALVVSSFLGGEVPQAGAEEPEYGCATDIHCTCESGNAQLTMVSTLPPEIGEMILCTARDRAGDLLRRVPIGIAPHTGNPDAQNRGDDFVGFAPQGFLGEFACDIELMPNQLYQHPHPITHMTTDAEGPAQEAPDQLMIITEFATQTRVLTKQNWLRGEIRRVTVYTGTLTYRDADHKTAECTLPPSMDPWDLQYIRVRTFFHPRQRNMVKPSTDESPVPIQQEQP